jgi:hypothetical protein
MNVFVASAFLTSSLDEISGPASCLGQVAFEEAAPENSALAQVVIRRLPITAALVRSLTRSCGIYGGQGGTMAGCLGVLWFSCQFSFNRLLHNHHLSAGNGTIGQRVADVPGGLSLTPLKEI